MPFFNFNTKKKITIWQGITGSLFHSQQASFGHIIIEEGVNLPEHSHFHEQWTHLIEGQMEFTVAGEIQVLSPGMTAFVPSNALHSGRAITNCKVID